MGYIDKFGLKVEGFLVVGVSDTEYAEKPIFKSSSITFSKLSNVRI